MFISTKKTLYYSSLNSSLSLFKHINNMVVITLKQLQRIINVVIDNYIQRHSPVFESTEFFNSTELLKSQNKNIDFDVIDNVEIFR